MAIYYIFLACAVMTGIFLCDYIPGKWGRRVYSFLMIAVLSGMAGWRFLTGHDYAAYLPIYTQNAFYDWGTFIAQRYEKGYIVTGRLLADLSLEPYVLFLAFGFLFAVMVILFCHRYSANLWLSIVSFVCFGLLYNSFCFMRQFAAMCILMWALRDVKEHRPFRFLILVLLASCFHISALVFIPFYLVFQFPLNKFVLPAYLVGSVLCYVFSLPLIRIVTSIYYKKYFNLKEGSELMLGARPGCFIGFALLLLVCLLLRKRLIERRAFNSILINCLYFGTFFEFIGIKHAIISRVAVLFMTPAIVLLVPELANVLASLIRKHRSGKVRKGSSYALACVILMVPMLLYHAYLLQINYNGVVPYRTLAEYYGIGGASWTN